MSRGSNASRGSTADRTDPRVEAALCARHLRLRLDQRAWKGRQGNWAGAGTGSSIDFQDHRPYVPGDNPRYIDWAAYARSGQTIMKLYREEVSPRLDLVIDASHSMSLTPAKAHLAASLLFFCVESALSLDTSLRLFLLQGSKSEPLEVDQLRHPDWTFPRAAGNGDTPDLSRLPFRGGSLRILISDLLFTTPPEDVLVHLTGRDGSAMVLCPFDPSEAEPDWADNMELIDCERRSSRRQRVDPVLLRRYREAYTRHMDAWRTAAVRYGIRFARLPAGPALPSALSGEPLHNRLVETWG